MICGDDFGKLKTIKRPKLLQAVYRLLFCFFSRFILKSNKYLKDYSLAISKNELGKSIYTNRGSHYLFISPIKKYSRWINNLFNKSSGNREIDVRLNYVSTLIILKQLLLDQK